MTAPDKHNARARALSMTQLGQRLLVAIGLVSVAILAAWLWLSWEQTRSAQIARMTTTVKLLAAHADHYFASVGNKLEAVAKELEDMNPRHDSQQVAALLLAAKAGNPDIHQISLARPDGLVLTTTAVGEHAMPNLRTDPARRVEFDTALKATGLSIGLPRLSLIQSQWVIPLRYSVRDRSGRIRYVILTGILLDQQQQLWRNIGLPADAALGL